MIRKKFEAGFKVQAALEAMKGENTLAEMSSEYEVHANLISRWKQELLQGATEIFNDKHGKRDNGQEATVENLYKSIGKLKVENNWLKKK